MHATPARRLQPSFRLTTRPWGQTAQATPASPHAHAQQLLASPTSPRTPAQQLSPPLAPAQVLCLIAEASWCNLFFKVLQYCEQLLSQTDLLQDYAKLQLPPTSFAGQPPTSTWIQSHAMKPVVSAAVTRALR
jgi:hypothetical protein